MSRTPPRIGLIGFGEVAGQLVAGLRGEGVVDFVAQVVSPRAAAAAQAAGITAGTDPALLADRDVVLACVPGRAVVEAVTAAAPGLGPRTLYADLASADPATKRVAAARLPAGGFIDGAILGAVAESGHRVPLALSGPRAADLAAALAPWGMQAEIVGVQIGQAAAIRLTRSIFMKGLEALYVETLVTARRLGVLDPVRASLDQFVDARPAAATTRMLLRSHLAHAARRADEAAQAAALAAEAGIDPVLAIATTRVMARTAAADLAGPASALSETDQFVALLDHALAASLRPGAPT